LYATFKTRYEYTMNAALYTRVSTRSQAEKHGTAYQREALERMVVARGWSVQGIYADEGVSGRLARRPGLDALMVAARRREVDVVAVWRFDRFARSLSHLVNALQEFQALGVQFVSHQEGLDTSTPIGMAMFQIAGAMAELEANLARERVQAGVDAARARGVVVGRPREGLTPQEAREAVSRFGGIRPAARALSVSPSLMARRLREP
jgi:DNA invertase Pin-like site-specific DNA recombinase